MTKAKKALKYILWLVVMLIIAVIMFYPFIFSLLGGLMSSKEFGQNLGMMLPIPSLPLYWKNFTTIFTPAGIMPLLNTVIRTAWYTFWVLMMAFLTGFVMSRYNFRGKKLLFVIIICSQVIPGVLTLIPTFVMAARIPFAGGNNWLGQGGSGLINSSWMLYLPFGWGYLIWVFLMMQSLRTQPKDFEEAAEIDGCGFMRTLFQVVLPMQLPMLAVIGVNVALAVWNDWLTPFMYINDQQKSTLPAYVGMLTSRLQEFGTRDYPKVFGLATMATLPPFFIFLFLQKYIIQGIASAGVKG